MFTVPRSRKLVLTPQQVHAIMGALAPQHRVLVVLLALTGLRISEALGLQWQDVDFAAGTFTVVHGCVRGRVKDSPKTEAAEGARPMGPKLATALLQHHAASLYTAPGNHVFCASNGSPLIADDWRKRVWYPALQRAGVQRTKPRAFGFHVLRHTAITMFLEQTRDVKATQMFAGHSNIGTTMNTYAKYLPKTAQDDAARFEQKMLPSGEPLVVVSGEPSGVQ